MLHKKKDRGDGYKVMDMNLLFMPGVFGHEILFVVTLNRANFQLNKHGGAILLAKSSEQFLANVAVRHEIIQFEGVSPFHREEATSCKCMRVHRPVQDDTDNSNLI